VASKYTVLSTSPAIAAAQIPASRSQYRKLLSRITWTGVKLPAISTKIAAWSRRRSTLRPAVSGVSRW
jgi:hypothetical protein